MSAIACCGCRRRRFGRRWVTQRGRRDISKQWAGRASDCYRRGTYLAFLMQGLWALGYAEQAQQRHAEALALAQQCGDPASVAYANLFGAVLAQLGRDAATTAAHAETLIAFATAQGLAHRVVNGRLLLGWALAMQGDAAAGVTLKLA